MQKGLFVASTVDILDKFVVTLLILSLTSHRRHLCFFFEWIREAGARPPSDIGFLLFYNGKSDLNKSLLLVLKKYYVVNAFYR